MLSCPCHSCSLAGRPFLPGVVDEDGISRLKERHVQMVKRVLPLQYAF